MGEMGPGDFSRFQRFLESDEYGLLEPRPESKSRTPDDKLRQAFAEIVEFYLSNGREPNPLSSEIRERRLGARLEGLRISKERRALLVEIDEFNLLSNSTGQVAIGDLLAREPQADPLGLLEEESGLLDMSNLPKAPRRQEQKGDVAKRKRCKDFERFQPLFRQKHAELSEGLAQLVPFRGIASITAGQFFVLGGLIVFVAEVGETEYQKNKAGDARKRERLRLIFENGTESAMYRQSLAIRLTEGIAGYQIAPVESDFQLLGDVSTGWVYVLRSLSMNPAISSLSHLHKIGFTTQEISKRIANSSKEPTYLMAPVEVVAEYQTYNIKPAALEHLLHRIFSDVRLDISQVGLDGEKYDSTEWFQVPLPVIDEAIELITTGEIVDYMYDPNLLALRRTGDSSPK